MDDMKLDLSPRYYGAEVTVWLLSAILVVARIIGLAPSQSLPVIELTLENNQHYFLIVAGLLIAAMMYLFFEWEQSSQKARDSYWAKARAVFTTLWACTSLWLCYPLIAANTPFTNLSPAWYLGFMVIGYLLGMYVSDLAIASLMIRTPTEARTLNLPRIPVIIRIQYKVWIPIVFLLLFAYFVLWYLSPDVIKATGTICVGVLFLVTIGKEFAWLLLSQDEAGKRITRLALLRKICNNQDYNYFLYKYGAKEFEKLGISTKESPEAIQKAMQERFSPKFAIKNLSVQQQENTLHVRVIPNNPKEESRDIEIPGDLFKASFDEYISTHSDGSVSEDLIKAATQHSLDQAVKSTIAQQTRPLLQRDVEAGQEERVKELLLKPDMDVNEQAEGGWTALLYASAQGYPRIMRLLLDAGANPDMGNLLGITPLIYGARYGNLDVCSILLEYGANTDIQDDIGWTALIVATRQGHVEVAEMLLKAGANIAIKDRNFMTALDHAQKCKRGKIAKLIRTAKKSIQPTK